MLFQESNEVLDVAKSLIVLCAHIFFKRLIMDATFVVWVRSIRSVKEIICS